MPSHGHTLRRGVPVKLYKVNSKTSFAIMAEKDGRISNEILPADEPPRCPPPSVPTRIILRLLVEDFDNNTRGYSWTQYPCAIEAYLIWAHRPLADWSEKKHNIFVESFQDLEVMQKRFHVIIDLQSLSFEVKNMDQVYHEIYEIKRDSEGKL